MQEFLKELLRKIEEVDLKNAKTLAPKGEPSVSGKVLGTLPDNLKKFWFVLDAETANMDQRCKEYHKKLEKILAKKPTDATPEDLKFVQQHILMHDRNEMVTSLFWQGVKEAFPEVLIFGRGKITLCKDWQVVIESQWSSLIPPIAQVFDLWAKM